MQEDLSISYMTSLGIHERTISVYQEAARQDGMSLDSFMLRLLTGVALRHLHREDQKTVR